MLDSAETITNPSREAPTTKSQPEEAGPRPGRYEPRSDPNQENVDNEPGHEETDATPDDEKMKPRLELKQLFTFDGGYGNPPKGSWYRPGTSGNPGGRPKGSKNKPKKLTDKNFNEILRSELYKEVKVKDGKTVSTARAVTQKLADLALAGNIRAMQLVITSLRAVDAADAARQEAEYNYAVGYKAHWENREPGGLNQVPSPDHIVLDHMNKKAMFTGPRNEEEIKKLLAGVDFREEYTDDEDQQEDEEEDEVSFRTSELNRRA